MSAVQTEILDKISSMTVLELSELIKAMEDKFGVSAAAAVAVAGPASAATFRVDPSRSSLVVQIFRDGVAAKLGHDHVVQATAFSGSVTYEPSAPGLSSIAAQVHTAALKVDDAQGDGPEQTVNGLEAGKEREVTFGDVKLKKGEHTLTATADAKGAIAESDEGNNDRAVTARCKDDN